MNIPHFTGNCMTLRPLDKRKGSYASDFWRCSGSTESYASYGIQSYPVNAALIHLNDWPPAGSPQPVTGHLVSHSNQHQAGQFKFPRDRIGGLHIQLKGCLPQCCATDRLSASIFVGPFMSLLLSHFFGSAYLCEGVTYAIMLQ